MRRTRTIIDLLSFRTALPFTHKARVHKASEPGVIHQSTALPGGPMASTTGMRRTSSSSIASPYRSDGDVPTFKDFEDKEHGPPRNVLAALGSGWALRVRAAARDPWGTARAVIPILQWLPTYDLRLTGDSEVAGDVAAGLTVGAMLIPQGLSYSMVAALPPIYGLYTSMMGCVIYAFFGSSRQLSVAPVAIVSLMVAEGVGHVAPPKLEDGSANPDYISLAFFCAFLSGIIQLVMGMLQFGFVVNFISHPVMSGFTSAAAIIIGLTQLKHVMGYSIDSGDLHEVIVSIFEGIHESNWPSILMGFISIAFILGCKYHPKLKALPTQLIVVVVGIIVVALARLDKESGGNIKIVGHVPDGLPPGSNPFRLAAENVGALLPVAFNMSLIGFLESIAVGKKYAQEYGYEVSTNTELVALGITNLVGSFTSCYPCTGGFSRTAVNAASGAKTPLASLISGFLIMIVLLVLTSLFYYLPNPVLGAVVIAAVSGLIDTQLPIELWKSAQFLDLLALIVCALTTLFAGVETGIMTGVVLSLVLVIFTVSQPNSAELGVIPGSLEGNGDEIILSASSSGPNEAVTLLDVVISNSTENIPTSTELLHALSHADFRDISRKRGLATRVRGVLVYRFDADIFFFNSGAFQEYLFEFLKKRSMGITPGEVGHGDKSDPEAPPNSEGGDDEREVLHSVVWDAGPCGSVDSAGLHVLHDSIKALEARGIRLYVARARAGLRDILQVDAGGFAEHVGYENFCSTVGACVAIALSNKQIPAEVDNETIEVSDDAV